MFVPNILFSRNCLDWARIINHISRLINIGHNPNKATIIFTLAELILICFKHNSCYKFDYFLLVIAYIIVVLEFYNSEQIEYKIM